MNLALWLARASRDFAEKDALFHGTKSVASYAVLGRLVAQTATWLSERGIRVGERVAIFMPNRPDYLPLLYAVWYLGGVVVPVNAKLHPKEAAWVFENSGAKLAFVMADFNKALENELNSKSVIELVPLNSNSLLEFSVDCIPMAPVERNNDDLAWLFYTSGTTGRPKGVMITHGMLSAMALNYFVDVDAVYKDDVTIYAAPMSHGAGIYNLMHVLRGAGHVYPLSGGFDPSEIFTLAAHFGSAHMFLAPTMIKRMSQIASKREDKPKGFRTIVYGGGPMYVADIIEAVDIFGDVFVQIYGQGECPMAISVLSRKDVSDRSHIRWKDRLVSVGKAQSIVQVQIVDEAGAALPFGSDGEIMVRGSAVMPGYWNNPEATKTTITNNWLITGDIGAIDKDGYLTLRDRSKDLIISGGSNIYPREIEEVLLMCPGVEEASIVGKPHPEWGEEVVAFVVPKAGYEIRKEELDALCEHNIARFKRPKHYVCLNELPKNSYGKVLKAGLRKLI